MLRVFAAIFLILGSASGLPASDDTILVRSVGELRKLGILVERLQHDTPMASVEIGSLVEVEKIVGDYDHTECVVLSAPVDAGKLPQADLGGLEAAAVTRRIESSKARSIFLVLGRDLPKAYLAFQFTTRDGEAVKTVRYLFPAAEIGAVRP